MLWFDMYASNLWINIILIINIKTKKKNGFTTYDHLWWIVENIYKLIRTNFIYNLDLIYIYGITIELFQIII
jgi:hypothetical protein